MIVLSYIRQAFFWLAVVAAVICLVDWLVRTRRISPFGPIARFFKHTIDPLMVSIERSVVRAGGMPTSAPWWTLVAVVISGIILINVIEFLFVQAATIADATQSGPTGVLKLLIEWTFKLLQFALLVRVISGWIRVSPYSRWVRWSYSLTEWFLRPLRQFIPPIGPGIDISPIVAYFLLRLVATLILSIF
jgi:YggT family protein